MEILKKLGILKKVSLTAKNLTQKQLELEKQERQVNLVST